MTDLAPYIERLAEYLVNERRRVDAMLNEGCDPYPDWAEASDKLKANARKSALAILMGELK